MDRKKVDARLKDLEEEIVLLAGHLGGAVAEELSGTLEKLGSRIDSLRASLPSGGGTTAGDTAAGLKEVRAALDGIAATLGTDREQAQQTIITRVDSLEQSLTTELSGIGGTIGKSAGDSRATVTDLGTEIKTAFDNGIAGLGNDFRQKLDSSVDGLGKDLRGALGKNATDLGAQLDDQTKTLSAATGRMQTSLAEAITGLARKTDDIAALLSSGNDDGIGGQIAGIARTVRESTASLPTLPEQIRDGLAAVDENLGKRFDTAAAGIEDARATLMKDHDELHRSLEIIRRMCTTDEEKYLGTLVSIMHERIGEVAAGLPDLTGTVKQKLSVLDKNLQVASQNTMTKQDEVKKLLLYDITAIAETAKDIRGLCDTGTNTSLGEEAARTGERIDQVAADVPEVLARVTDIASGMEQLAAQVRLMRWFVLGAVGVSLTVLGLSIFL